MSLRPPAVVALTAAMLCPAPVLASNPPQLGASAQAAGSTPTITLSVNTRTAQVSKTVRATVRTPGNRKVRIQTRTSTTDWQTVASGRASGGRAQIPFTTFKEGTWQIRAAVHASGRTVTSNRVSLKSIYPGFTPPPEDRLAPMRPGQLQINKAAAGVYQLGEFRVTVARNAPVTAFDGAGRLAWSSDRTAAFVSAARSRLRWFQRSTAGAFWPQVTRLARLRDQSITSARQDGQSLQLRGVLSGGGDHARYQVTFTPVQPSADVSSLQMTVEFRLRKNDVDPTSVQLTSGRAANAGVHGFGTQFQDFDLNGEVLPILVQEQGVTRGEKPAATTIDAATWGAGNLRTTYGAWPTYVTDQYRSFALADTRRSGALSVANMSRPRQISLESFRNQLTATVLARSNPTDLLAARAAGVSRPELANWITSGAVLGIQGGTAKVRQVVADMQAAGTKISGVWLQDWVGKRVTSFGEQLWWTWQLDRTTYPDWEQMVSDFNAQGIRVMTYVNPFVINADMVNGKPIRNLYKEARSKGYLVRNERGGKPYVVQTVGFPTALVDLTNPAARDWFAQVIADQVLGVGASGFMADFGEYLPSDAKVANGSARAQHNRWPQLWARTVRDACQRGGVPDCVSFFRSSYLGSPHNVPLMWAGDQMVNYAQQDGMPNALKGMLAGGISGAPLWHSDIGGYTSVNAAVTNFIRPPQLNARWAEMEAFGVVMRTHETNRPTLNQQVYDTPQTRAQFARASQIYAALRDYRTAVIQEAVQKGIPAMRSGWQVYPGTNAAKADTQFFLGDHLLVAPVYAENATTAQVTFPPGQWRHVLTGQVFAGDATTSVPAPIGTPAAFVKVGDPVGDQIVAALQAAL